MSFVVLFLFFCIWDRVANIWKEGGERLVLSDLPNNSSDTVRRLKDYSVELKYRVSHTKLLFILGSLSDSSLILNSYLNTPPHPVFIHRQFVNASTINALHNV